MNKFKIRINLLTTRIGKLEEKIKLELKSKSPSVDTILGYVNEYEKDNLATIEKLRKEKKIEINRINGAIKQCFKAHPVITKELTGSLSKRIYGALLSGEKKENKIIIFYKNFLNLWKKTKKQYQ